MALHRRPSRARRETTIPLINVVFLLLVFFLVAGTIAPPLDRDVTLVDTAALEGAPPPDAVVLRADGRLFYRGAEIDTADYLAQRLSDPAATVRIVPDRAVPAQRLIAVAAALRGDAARDVVIVTRRGVE
ncbi:ExbD/TolR family protein [Meridianimarinicoccus sp. RP-17]|uniref:ExbD/TolR family protein n=1 Tax=Meridianimarinicoccus zhengii TaxID=2056810 RepID=UPI000DAE4183|nr:biopolymer transporter ExbD [Phycocomes zhengii]